MPEAAEVAVAAVTPECRVMAATASLVDAEDRAGAQADGTGAMVFAAGTEDSGGTTSTIGSSTEGDSASGRPSSSSVDGQGTGAGRATTPAGQAMDMDTPIRWTTTLDRRCMAMAETRTR